MSENCKIDVDEAIREGWLDGIHAARISINLPERNKLLVDKWQNTAGDNPTICVAIDEKYAQALAHEFSIQGVKAAAIWENDPCEKVKLEQFSQGELRVLLLCHGLLDGYDRSHVRCVVSTNNDVSCGGVFHPDRQGRNI